MGTDLGATEPVVSTGSAALLSLVFAGSALVCCFDGLAAAICLPLLPALPLFLLIWLPDDWVARDLRQPIWRAETSWPS